MVGTSTGGAPYDREPLAHLAGLVLGARHQPSSRRAQLSHQFSFARLVTVLPMVTIRLSGLESLPFANLGSVAPRTAGSVNP